MYMLVISESVVANICKQLFDIVYELRKMTAKIIAISFSLYKAV